MLLAVLSLCVLAACGSPDAAVPPAAPRAVSAVDDSGLFLAAPPVPKGACIRGLDVPRAPRFSQARVPSSVLDGFAVLRRDKSARDRLPASSRDQLRTDGVRTVYAAYVRRVGAIATGSAYFAIPATVHARLDARCLRRLSPGRRATQRRLARRLQRTLFVFLTNFDNGGGSYAAPAAAALAGRAFASSDGPPSDDPLRVPIAVAVLAPDGAATIEARYPGVEPITATVRDNFATFVHTLRLAPDARGFPNFHPETAIFKRPDGGELLQSRPPADAPTFGE